MDLNATPIPVMTPSAQEMVDALHVAFGDHHTRAVHAKGILVNGTFVPSREARDLSAASLFEGDPVPVLARFSDFTGIPDIPDTADGANPRGLAIKLSLPDGSTMDIVAHSFNGFPVATAAEFRDLMLSIGASGPGAAKPTPLDTFLEAHPKARTFLTTQKPAPASYATLSYFGVNAFCFTNSAGQAIHVRYRFVPALGEAFVSLTELPMKGPNYLMEELPSRLARGPFAFEWLAQVATEGDVIGDRSVPWPENRRLIRLGTIQIEALIPDGEAAGRGTVSLPVNLPHGIEPADPMLLVRQAAYPISFHHRQ